jgi:hypothetical protein
LATTASAGTAKSVTASSKGVVASFTGGSHSPKVNQPWKFLITASRNGHAAKAEVTYEFAFNGQVVAKREHYVFVGKRADAITWPSSAVGYPLEFRAAISSEGASINLDYPVRVSP